MEREGISVHKQDGEGCARQSEVAKIDEGPKSPNGDNELIMINFFKEHVRKKKSIGKTITEVQQHYQMLLKNNTNHFTSFCQKHYGDLQNKQQH